MADFLVLPSDFSATTITFVANSQAAKARLDGGISVDIRKSAAPMFLDKLEAEGFQVSLS